MALETAFDDVPPFPIQSIDHTFNVNKRTSTYVPPPDPELLSDSANTRPRHVSKEANAFLVSMGANSVVSSTSISVLFNEVVTYLAFL